VQTLVRWGCGDTDPLRLGLLLGLLVQRLLQPQHGDGGGPVNHAAVARPV
jgi:hypothetical protein